MPDTLRFLKTVQLAVSLLVMLLIWMVYPGALAAFASLAGRH